MKILPLLLCFLASVNLQGQLEKNYAERDLKMKVKGDSLDAKLLTPLKKNQYTLLILVAGSGPTDMDGNSWTGVSGFRNNSLKMLAESMAQKGIASFRYDKRGIRPLKKYYLEKIPFNSEEMQRFESELRFDDFVNDLVSIIRQLKNDKRFTKIIVAGHSEGSLIGMLAARTNNVDGFISISGPAFPADSVLLEQIKLKSKIEVSSESRELIRKIKNSEKIDTIIHPLNKMHFRESVRPYMAGWFRHDPSLTLSSLKMPVMIIHGSADLQVAESQAHALKTAVPLARLLIVQNMNHVLKITPSAFENQLSYNHPTLAVSAELLDGIEDFINKLP